MGYFADIIKDSRQPLVASRRPAPPSSVPIRPPSAEVAADAASRPAGQAREPVTSRTQIYPDTRLLPTPATAVDSRSEPAEIGKAAGPKAKRVQREKKSGETRSRRRPVDEHFDPVDPTEAGHEHTARPVLQRKSPAASPRHSSVKAGPTISRSTSSRAGSPQMPTRAAAPTLSGEGPVRPTLPAVDRGTAAPGPSQQPKPPGTTLIEPGTAPFAEHSPASVGQPNRPADAAVPVEATIKTAIIKPDSSASSMASAHHVVNVNIPSGGRNGAPRVQIGQVNVVVEQSQMPTKSQPGYPRADDLASRTFLRSL